MSAQPASTHRAVEGHYSAACVDALTASTDREEMMVLTRVAGAAKRLKANTDWLDNSSADNRARLDRPFQADWVGPPCGLETIGSWVGRSAVNVSFGRILYRIARAAVAPFWRSVPGLVSPLPT